MTLGWIAEIYYRLNHTTPLLTTHPNEMIAIGLTLLVIGLLIRFAYSPNQSSPKKRKRVALRYQVTDAGLRAFKPQFFVDKDGRVGFFKIHS